MRTNIDIDDDLMAAAMRAGGFTTKKETVEEALRLLARRSAYEGVRALRGTTKWEGSLNEMRQDRADYSVLWDDKLETTKQKVKRVTKRATAQTTKQTAKRK
jgi:Arc/MetJ family transcription regulator